MTAARCVNTQMRAVYGGGQNWPQHRRHTAKKKERMRRPYFYRVPASSCNRRQFNRQLSLAFNSEGSGEPSAEKLLEKRSSVLAYATQSNLC